VPQQGANNQKATRKHPESNQKATSWWPNIPQRISRNIRQHVQQHMPEQRPFAEALQPQQRANYHKATRTLPESNQKATSSSCPSIIPQNFQTTYARTYSTTDATAKSIRRSTTAIANTKLSQSNQKAKRKQP
jgi:hypothetical protein